MATGSGDVVKCFICNNNLIVVIAQLMYWQSMKLVQFCTFNKEFCITLQTMITHTVTEYNRIFTYSVFLAVFC